MKADSKCGMSERSSFRGPNGAFLLSLFLCAVLLDSPARAEELLEKKGPVTITSLTLTADNRARTALFEGSVTARTETATLYSDKMLVHYTEKGTITKIEASGNVRLLKGERVITANEAAYFADEEKVLFTGNPRAVEGSTMVTGTKMIYLMKEDRSIVENSKVFMEKEIQKGR